MRKPEKLHPLDREGQAREVLPSQEQSEHLVLVSREDKNDEERENKE